MDPAFVLIHSPFLGPASWRPVARCLERAGSVARVPSLRGVATSAPPYWPAGVDAVVRAVGDEAVVLVAHSNGGLFVPAVAQRLGEQVRGVVFVDASVPGAGHHSTPEFLRGLEIVDGLLPPWTSWWDEPDVAVLFPDAEVRAQVESEQPRMPLAYYDHLPPTPDGWDTMPCGLIWFGAPYDKGADEAVVRGWPVEHVPGHHLQMLVDPDGVAAAVLRMAQPWT